MRSDLNVAWLQSKNQNLGAEGSMTIQVEMGMNNEKILLYNIYSHA